MYQVEASKALLKPRLWARRSARLKVPRNVVMLGMVSMLTDISSEMVATILPLYLVFTLGASPLALGAIDGTYRGAAALVQVASGFVSDRWRKPKEVAGAGYGISAVGKVALVAAGNTIGGIGAIVAFDRIGKGIRTAPRDALISLSSSKAGLATAFGVHRAMDSAGAMLGPLIAFGILLAAPARFDAVFVVSTLFAVLGLAVLVLTVQGKPKRAPREDKPAPSLRAAAGLVQRPPLRAAAGRRRRALADQRLRRDDLRRPAAQDRLRAGRLPAALRDHRGRLHGPGDPGRAARRPGRPRAGAARRLRPALHRLRRAADELARLRRCWSSACVGLGGYFAATEGVLAAIAGAMLPEDLQASGIGMLTTVVSIGNLLSSLVFGALWLDARAAAAR